MKKLLLFFLILGQVSSALAQGKVYTSLEEALKTPEQVTQLRLAHHHFSTFPQDIFHFKNLESLSLIYCDITELPDEIAQLKKLKALVLSYNQLTKLPNEIGQLTKLQKLSLYANKLSKLPPSFGQLKQLTWVDLGKNQFTAFPPVLLQLPHLQKVNLYNNQLNTLPSDILSWARQHTLDVHKNSLQQVDPQIVKQLHQVMHVPSPPPPPPPPVKSERTQGKIQARKDFQKGIMQFVFYGYPDNREQIAVYVKELKKIGITVQNRRYISEEWAEGYNDFMHKKLQAKLGKDYWIKPNIKADMAVNYHVPMLSKINIFTGSDVIDFTDYFRPLLKKVVPKRFNQKEIHFEVTVDTSLKTQKVIVTQGVSSRIDQKCIRLLLNAAWTKPYSSTYLNHYKQVVFKGMATLYGQM
ncbi:hypothetical protein BKI52_11235 [marine bacterium AO1-C]|nr:hypothetical protein BKI52_11235 [marine bacterium AO1-C]